MEALFKIWGILTEAFGAFGGALMFVIVAALWLIFKPSLISIGEWCDGKIRGKLSLPPKLTPPSE